MKQVVVALLSVFAISVAYAEEAAKTPDPAKTKVEKAEAPKKAGAKKEDEVIEIQEFTAVVVRQKDSKKTIKFLKIIKEDRLAVANKEVDGKHESVVQVEFKFEGKDWTLLKGEDQISPVEPGGDLYHVSVVLKGEITPLNLVGISPNGELEKESLAIKVNKFAEFQKQKFYLEKKAATKKRNHLSVSLGPSLLLYNQTGKPDYSSVTTTAKAAYRFSISQNWDVGVTAFMNIVPLTSSDPDHTARFLGVNFRFGFALPFIKAPWRVSLLGGGYYNRMFVTGDAFGLSNVFGPQVFPTISRTFSNGHAAYTYFKFSPISASFSFRSLDNREMAVGAGWTHMFKQRYPVSFSLDFSNMVIVIRTITAGLTTVSFSVGYNF